MTTSLYEKMGGETIVDATVDLFYRKVLRDERVSRFFDTTDMEVQRAKQKSFLTMVYGGPNNYTGKDLRKAHAPLVEQGMNDTHFDAVLEHLESSLSELDVPRNFIDEVISLAEGMRADVLGA